MCITNSHQAAYRHLHALQMAKKSAISVEQSTKEDLADKSTDGKKRLKTGGRASMTIDQQIILAAHRSKISELNDDVTLESPLAALFLGISVKKLEELRRPIKTSEFGAIPRLPFLKIFAAGAIGQNQPILYKLGDLRTFQNSIRVTDSHQAAVGAGLALWLNTKHPFFVKKSNAGELFILGNAWDMHVPDREKLFLELVTGRISIKSMKLTVAAIGPWQSYTDQSNFIVKCEDLWNQKFINQQL